MCGRFRKAPLVIAVRADVDRPVGSCQARVDRSKREKNGLEALPRAFPQWRRVIHKRLDVIHKFMSTSLFYASPLPLFSPCCPLCRSCGVLASDLERHGKHGECHVSAMLPRRPRKPLAGDGSGALAARFLSLSWKGAPGAEGFDGQCTKGPWAI